MDVEAQAKEIAERIGWPYAHAAHIRCAGVEDIKRALIAFSDEKTKALQAEIERLRSLLHLIPDNPPVTGLPNVDLAMRITPKE